MIDFTGFILPRIPFGVEMETIAPNTISSVFMNDAQQTHNMTDLAYQTSHSKAVLHILPQLRHLLGPVFPSIRYFTYEDSKNDKAYDEWKITTDQSIRADSTTPAFVIGHEYISPKLVGYSGITEVSNFCRALQVLHVTVNTTTALHVHVSCADLTDAQLLRFCQYALLFEPVVDTFVTYPRRRDYSRYCRSNIRSVSSTRQFAEAYARISQVKSLEELISTMCPRLTNVVSSDRNHKINMILLRKSTRVEERRIEFRQHHGTVDPQEVCMWVALMQRYLHHCALAPPLPKISENMTETTGLFWRLIDCPALQEYYTKRAASLPGAEVNFSYEARELYGPEDDYDPLRVVNQTSTVQQPTAPTYTDNSIAGDSFPVPKPNAMIQSKLKDIVVSSSRPPQTQTAVPTPQIVPTPQVIPPPVDNVNGGGGLFQMMEGNSDEGTDSDDDGVKNSIPFNAIEQWGTSKPVLRKVPTVVAEATVKEKGVVSTGYDLFTPVTIGIQTLCSIESPQGMKSVSLVDPRSILGVLGRGYWSMDDSRSLGCDGVRIYTPQGTATDTFKHAHLAAVNPLLHDVHIYLHLPYANVSEMVRLGKCLCAWLCLREPTADNDITLMRKTLDRCKDPKDVRQTMHGYFGGHTRSSVNYDAMVDTLPGNVGRVIDVSIQYGMTSNENDDARWNTVLSQDVLQLLVFLGNANVVNTMNSIQDMGALLQDTDGGRKRLKKNR